MNNEQCFAVNSKGKCGATSGGSCPGHENCPLFKPRWLQRLDLKRVHARLCTLPEKKQSEISEKYYYGKIPWRGEAQ